jgi:hypothetical protein
MSGCVKAIIILFVLFVVAVVAFFIFAGALINNLARDLGIDPNGGGNGSIGADCPFLSDSDARGVLGGDADAIELSGLADASIGIIIDKRVLASAPDCWVTDGDKAFIARVARYEGGDAATMYAAEKKAAEPTSQDQGGGVTLTTDGYFGGEVSGLGDEAFCTGFSGVMAGVLVHQGNRLVYVSVGPPDDNAAPALDATGDGTVIAPALCELSQEVARVVLR